jgi:hypothetical protein
MAPAARNRSPYVYQSLPRYRSINKPVEEGFETRLVNQNFDYNQIGRRAADCGQRGETTGVATPKLITGSTREPADRETTARPTLSLQK